MSKLSPGVLAPPHEVLTPDEWRSRGRERRGLVPRSSHAQWAPPEDRPEPVAILEEQARTRVPDLVPIRYGRMVASQFAYFRGAAAPMAWDLAHTPTTDIRVQACGDAHLLNFGMFAAPDGGWSSTSTTSMRRFRRRSTGTSSAWRRASRSPRGRMASRTARLVPRRVWPCAAIAPKWRTMPRCGS